MIKIKVSYTSENELTAFLRHVAVKYPGMRWKRSENRKGQYRKDNIYTEILSASNALDNAEVPETGRVLLVKPDIYLLMKQCKDITMETDIGNDMRLRGVISNLDGCNVVKVPEKRLPKNFCFMMAHPVATVAPTKLEDYKTHQDPPGISGELVEGRICYDAFVLENKAKAIYYQEYKAAV